MELRMDKKDLKKLLAGLSLVALIGGAGLSLTGCAATGGAADSAKDSATDPAADNAKDPAIDPSTKDNTDGNLTA
jgi:radical SAM modification target selenobiotic family peptide